jgi:hypothetical protein
MEQDHILKQNPSLDDVKAQASMARRGVRGASAPDYDSLAKINPVEGSA